MTYQELVKMYPWVDLALELFKGIMPTAIALFTIFMTELFIRKRNKINKKREMELQYLQEMLSWIHEIKQDIFEISVTLNKVLLKEIPERIPKLNEVKSQMTEMNKSAFILCDTYKEISACMGYDFDFDQFKSAIINYSEAIDKIGHKYLYHINTEKSVEEVNSVIEQTKENINVSSSRLVSNISLLYGKKKHKRIDLISNIGEKQMFKKNKKMYKPYGFDERVEYKIYSQIGERHRKEFLGKMKKREEKFLMFDKYSEWERYFIDKFLKGESNDCNIQHYLIRKLRMQKRCEELYKTVVVPIYVLLVSAIVSMYSSKNYSISQLINALLVGIIIILVASLFSIQFYSTRKCFYKDCINIIENFNTSHQK